MTALLRMMILLIALGIATIVVWSYPTMYGDTGLVVMPTADTLTYTFIDLGLNTTRYNGALGKGNTYPIRLTFGASDDSEFFVVLSEASGKNNTMPDVFGGGLKYRLVREDPYTHMPGVAVGVRVVNMKGGLFDQNVVNAYGVVSKALFTSGDDTDAGFQIRAHGALEFTQYSGDRKGSFYGLLAGLSYRSDSGTEFAVDIVPAQKKGDVKFRETSYSVAVRRPLSKEFKAEFGFAPVFGGENAFYAGILYEYGERDIPQVKRK